MPDNAKSPPEPSMEEIIASISRIITEDKRPIEAINPISARDSDILELTEVVNEDGSVRRMTSSASASNASAGGPAAGAAPADTRATEKNEPPDAGIEQRLELGRERILSSAKSEAAAAAFARLSGLPRDRRRESELPLGGTDRTLE